MGANDNGAVGCLHFRCRERGLGLQSEDIASEFRRGRIALQDRCPCRREGELLSRLFRLGRCRCLMWARDKRGVPGGAVNPPLPAPFGEVLANVNLPGAAVRMAIVPVPIGAVLEPAPATGAARAFSTSNRLVGKREMMRCLRWLGHGFSKGEG